MHNSDSVLIAHGNPNVRQSIQSVAAELGCNSRFYDGFGQFFQDDVARGRQMGCIVAQLSSRLEYENWQATVKNGSDLSLIFTFDADFDLAIRAMREGAIDVIVDPLDRVKVKNAILDGLETSRQRHHERKDRESAQKRFSQLTRGEQLALPYFISGQPNKRIALRLDVGLRTVERRRHAVFSKVGVESAVELAETFRIAFPDHSKIDRAHRTPLRPHGPVVDTSAVRMTMQPGTQ